MKILGRIAAHLDPATELEDFQSAARLLIAHQLITERFPNPGALALVRRFEEPLRNEFHRLCHWRLDLAPTCARLMRRPASLSVHRPARTASQSRRPFTPRSYASLCLVLAALEALGAQTTISQLAEEALRLRAGDDELDLDLTQHAHRRAFVDAVAWLEERGVLTLLDGDTESFLAQGGDALYDVDADAASRLLISPPSILAGITSAEQFLEEPYPPTDDGSLARARHRVHRRLLTEHALYYEELPQIERDYARQRRTRIREEIERLTGCDLECRVEGQALVGLPAAEPFPAGGSVAQAALLLGGELVSSASAPGDPGDPDGIPGGVERVPSADAAAAAGRRVPAHEVARAWNRVVAAYGTRFTADYRTDPQRLRAEATSFLERLDLLIRSADGSVHVRPALARYRPNVRLPETLDVRLDA